MFIKGVRQDVKLVIRNDWNSYVTKKKKRSASRTHNFGTENIRKKSQANKPVVKKPCSKKRTHPS